MVLLTGYVRNLGTVRHDKPFSLDSITKFLYNKHWEKIELYTTVYGFYYR